MTDPTNAHTVNDCNCGRQQPGCIRCAVSARRMERIEDGEPEAVRAWLADPHVCHGELAKPAMESLLRQLDAKDALLGEMAAALRETLDVYGYAMSDSGYDDALNSLLSSDAAQAALRERDALLRKADQARQDEADPAKGAWRCSECGEMQVFSDPRWRWNGTAWEHHHGYPVGHVEARYFGEDPQEGERDALLEDKRRLDWLEAYSDLRITTTTDSGKHRKHIEGDGTALRVYGPTLRQAIDAMGERGKA